MDYLDQIDNMSLEELFDFLDYRKGHKVDYAEQEFRYELAREEEQLKYLEEFESLTKEFSLIKDTLEKLYEAKEYLEQLQNNEEEYKQCCKMINVLREKENCLGIQIYG